MRPSPTRRPRTWLLAGALLAALAIAGLVALLFVLPGLVASRCIEAAAARGVTLTLGGTQIGIGTVHLTGVTFRLDGVPQLEGRAADVDVSLHGLAPDRVEARGVEIAIDGPFDVVGAAVDRWRASHAAPGASGGAPSATTPTAIVVTSGHLAWKHAFGKTATIDATGIAAQADPRTDTLRFIGEQTHIARAEGETSFGPWRVTYERDAAIERTRIELEPAVRDGANADAHVVWTRTHATSATSLRASIPRAPLVRLGIPPALLGLPAGSPAETEATIALDEPLPTRADLKATLALFHARLGGAPMEVDVHLALEAHGDPQGALDVSRGTLTVGPIQAGLSGTVHLFPDGARADLAWRANPIPCASLARQMTAQVPFGDIGNQLGALAENLGLAKVTGDARASGQLTVDLRNLAETRFTVTAKDTCGVAIFP